MRQFQANAVPRQIQGHYVNFIGGDIVSEIWKEASFDCPIGVGRLPSIAFLLL